MKVADHVEASPSVRSVAAFGAPPSVTLMLVLGAPVVLALVGAVSGRIEVNGGRGWDGNMYAAMLERGWDAGTANTALRPLIVLLNRPLYWLTGDAVAAFSLMNYAYVALLVAGLCKLFDRHNGDAAAKTLFAVNVLLCIATLKMISFYPVLIDIGACAVLTLALWLIVSGRRWWSAVACVAAVLSREFGVAAIAFGVIRDLRTRVPLWQIALTYLPAAATWFGWRWVVANRWTGREGGILSADDFLGNLGDWRDPRFVGFFLYFLLTVFGGVSIYVFARLRVALRHVRAEPEWAAFAACVLAPAIAGSWDIWRYLAYLLPAFAVLFAVCAREAGPWRRHLPLTVALCVATVITQRPLQEIDLVAYFRDWFPYYVLQGATAHNADVPPAIWPLWIWRFLAAAGLLAIVSAMSAFPAARVHAHRA